ncbi:MAG: pyridoxamine 5'-phosphate oxidase family protein [Rhizobiales bacterium]|nr:pyridoxamine 5'-phosphate oxidase family protein [Hyphomicrobiales bacterium]
MLTADMKTLITNHRAGMVATINDDGTPSVSPKATFVIIDDARIAVGNIRSPGTVANLRKRPAVEVCFIDVITRKAVRVTGTAAITPKAEAEPVLMDAFDREWAAYLDHISGFIDITVTTAELILSPAYDLGLTEDELKAQNLDKLNAL